MSFTMDQIVRSGTPFNPLDSASDQGETFKGANFKRLFAAMKEYKWSDTRFVTPEQIEANGWSLQSGAVGVKVMRPGESVTQWDRGLVYNAAQVVGMPSLDEMLQQARKRLIPDVGISIASAPKQPPEKETVVSPLAKEAALDLDMDLVVGPTAQPEPQAITSTDYTLEVAPMLRSDGADPVLDGRPTPEYVAFSLPHTSVIESKVFQERQPGSGQFFRANEKKPAFVDKGASLVVHDKKQDAYQAVMELAKSKGWESIQLAGKPEHVARGWLEAQLMGIQVSNYSPTQMDLAALDKARNERVAAGSLHKAEVVCEGRHVGAIESVSDGYAIQRTGRHDQFVAHDLSKFDKAPAVGDMMDIQWRGGKANVVEPQTHDHSIGRSR